MRRQCMRRPASFFIALCCCFLCGHTPKCLKLKSVCCYCCCSFKLATKLMYNSVFFLSHWTNASSQCSPASCRHLSVREKWIYGLTIRSCNNNIMSPQTSKAKTFHVLIVGPLQVSRTALVLCDISAETKLILPKYIALFCVLMIPVWSAD